MLWEGRTSVHNGGLIAEQLLADVDGSSVAGLGGHEELASLEREQYAIATHARGGLARQPVGVVDAAGPSEVVPIELQVSGPAMAGAPEAGAILVATRIEVVGQDAHLGIAVEANA